MRHPDADGFQPYILPVVIVDRDQHELQATPKIPDVQLRGLYAGAQTELLLGDHIPAIAQNEHLHLSGLG